MGIEPTQPAWKAGILPLNYARIFARKSDRILKTAFLQVFLIPAEMPNTQTAPTRHPAHKPPSQEPHKRDWGKQDSNLRRLTPPDLQSGPFGHSGIPPLQ